MKKSLALIVLFALLCGFYSCTKDTASVAAPPVCDSTHISYTKTIAPIMDRYCTSCHNPTYGQGANDLTNYNAVRAGVADNSSPNSIICRTTPGQTCGTDLMPQGARNGLAQVYRDTLTLWKNGGYCN
jgi:hypothetical protein